MEDVSSAGLALLVFAVLAVVFGLWANRDKIKSRLSGGGSESKDNTRPR